jgi:probable addiction module antidote protein
MVKSKTTAFDAADYLDSEEMRLAYLKEAFETRDTEYIARAIGTVAKSRGMTAIAEATGLSRESLYRALGTKPNPEFSTVIKVLDSLGMELSVQPKQDDVEAA